MPTTSPLPRAGAAACSDPLNGVYVASRDPGSRLLMPAWPLGIRWKGRLPDPDPSPRLACGTSLFMRKVLEVADGGLGSQTTLSRSSTQKPPCTLCRAAQGPFPAAQHLPRSGSSLCHLASLSNSLPTPPLLRLCHCSLL